MKIPLVTIIIPTYNEEKDISNGLKSLLKQSFKNFDIIVVDDGSKDKTIEEIKKIKSKKIKIIRGEHKGPGFSRNKGAKSATGNILVFVDADMTFDRDYIKHLIYLIKHNKAIGTTHELEIVENTKNVWSRCWGKIRVSKDGAKDVKIFRAIKKDKFLEMGGFDPKYGYADDQTFWFKYKVKPTVAIKTICYHKNPENLKEVYKQSRWIGASIENKLLKNKVTGLLSILFLLVFSPINILLLSLIKCYKFRDYKLLPFMIIFITMRYYGTIQGMGRKIFLDRIVK